MTKDHIKVPGVIEEISPNDGEYTSEPAYYFFWGQQAVVAIDRFISLAGLPIAKAILDLPCGYGRVLRFLRAAFPAATITACDIDAKAVDFCTQTFDSQPVYSVEDLAAVPLPDKYDLIWCGSLLTHLPADEWLVLLRLFSLHLRNPGLLVFTTCGRHNAELLKSRRNTFGLTDSGVSAILSDYQRFGFGYQNYPGRQGYGLSLSSASWVCAQIQQVQGVEFAGYHVGGWGGIQDVVACVPVIQS